MPARWCAMSMENSRERAIRAATARRAGCKSGRTRAQLAGLEEEAELQAFGDALGLLPESPRLSRREEFVGGLGKHAEPALEHGRLDAGERGMHRHGIALVAA